MQHFETFTQYDHRYDQLWKDHPDAKKGFSCPHFAIITAYQFMKDGDVTQKRHEENIEHANTYCALTCANQRLGFIEMIELTDMKKDNIMCTTVDLIATGDFGFDKIFPQISSGRNAVIFLKNENFFVVLQDEKGYHVRDSHEPYQYFFPDMYALIAHMDTIYHFTDAINVDGISFDDYSSIEFIQISNKFTTELLTFLGVDSSQKQLHQMEYVNDGEEGYIETDDNILKYNSTGDESIFGDKTYDYVDFS